MSIRNRNRCARGRLTIVLSLTLSMQPLVGCSMLHKNPAPAPIAVDDQTPLPATPASIQISYAKPDDTLKSVVVMTFTGANVLRTVNEGDREASVVRFDGGVPIWKFHLNRSINPLSKTTAHVASIDYGIVPTGFVQDNPEVGPPPPLDPGGYYIFAIERGSGATSYQAVRVRFDSSLQAYDAEPRAGTSYKLCCDVSADFAQPTPENGVPEPESMPASAPPDSEQQP